MHPALDRPALDAGGNRLLDEIDAFLQGFHIYSDERSAHARDLWDERYPEARRGGSDHLTDGLREHAGLTDAVTFVGSGTSSSSGSRNAFRRISPRLAPWCGTRGAARGAGRIGGGTVCRAASRRERGARDGRGVGRKAPDAAGGPALHVPVLLAEVRDALDTARGGLFLDGTFGAGGYTRAILEDHPDNRVIAIDREPVRSRRPDPRRPASVSGSPWCMAASPRWTGSRANHGAEGGLDGIVIDIGVSSMQIDQAERGFSFRSDGPLDNAVWSRTARALPIFLQDAEEAEIRRRALPVRRGAALARHPPAHRGAAPAAGSRPRPNWSNSSPVHVRRSPA